MRKLRKYKVAAATAKVAGQRFVVSSGLDREGELVYRVGTCGDLTYGHVCLDEELSPDEFADVLDTMLAVWEGTEG
jgi:hypothetical protein